MEIRNHPGPGGYDRDKLFDKPREDVWLRPLRLRNEFVARYHYLGYKTLVGAQMRYAVHDRNGWPLAMLGFSTAAWKLAPRDNFIGWTPEKREKNLPLVVDNPRFLILPWVRIPNLGSHILAIVRRRLPEDWTARYNITPVLIETFVETPRYTGTVHKASGWTRVGATQGARAIRPAYQTSPAEKGHLAPIPPKRLAAHPQSVETSPGAVGRVCTCQGADNCLLIPQDTKGYPLFLPTAPRRTAQTFNPIRFRIAYG